MQELLEPSFVVTVDKSSGSTHIQVVVEKEVVAQHKLHEQQLIREKSHYDDDDDENHVIIVGGVELFFV